MPLGWREMRQVLCLGAHADDIEIGCGGALLSLIATQPHLEVVWVVLSGDSVRVAEAKKSAQCFTSKAARLELIQESFRDSFFPYEGLKLKEFFHSLAARTQPDLIFTHRHDDRHQDHRLVSELTWNAFRGRTILEYEIPKWEGDLGQPNLYLPVDPNIADQKIAALLEFFPSQRSKSWFDDETFRGLLRLRGLEAGGVSRYAEAFYARKLVALADNPVMQP